MSKNVTNETSVSEATASFNAVLFGAALVGIAVIPVWWGRLISAIMACLLYGAGLMGALKAGAATQETLQEGHSLRLSALEDSVGTLLGWERAGR